MARSLVLDTSSVEGSSPDAKAGADADADAAVNPEAEEADADRPDAQAFANPLLAELEEE
jgi:hypothetical protein